MVPLGRLRPRRTLLVPTIVLASPVLWFLFREVNRTGLDQSGGTAFDWTVAVAVGALLGSYLLAAVAVPTLQASGTGDHPVVRAVLEPRPTALCVFAALLGGVVGYVGLSAVVTIPAPLDALARLAGGLLALPLIALYGSVIVVANELGGGSAPAWLEWSAVAVGVMASVVWTAVLTDAVTRRVATDRRAP